MELVGVHSFKVLLLHRFSLLPQYGPRKRRNRPTIALASVSSAWARRIAATSGISWARRTSRWWPSATWTPRAARTPRRRSRSATPSKIKSGELQGLRRLQRFPRTARPQGHRRRRHRHARPLARHPLPRSVQGEEGHLLRKAADADHPRSQDADRRRPQVRARLPDRQPAALRAASSALACELVRSGRIGKLKTVYVERRQLRASRATCPRRRLEEGLDWDRWLGPAPKRPYNSVLSPRGVHGHFPDWRNYREYSGGMMTDWGAHHFDIAQWGLGMDESGPVRDHPARRSEGRAWACDTSTPTASR